MHNRSLIARTTDGRELMLAVKFDAPDAFSILAATYAGYIRNAISRYVRESSMVEDLAQDVLLRVFRARERYEAAAPFEAFLQTIIFNLCVNHQRYHRRRRAASLSAPTESAELLGATVADAHADAPDEESMRRERAVAVQLAISRLPGGQRQALMLSHFDGLPHEEIGRRVGLSVAAVKSLIWRARENLRKSLAGRLGDQREAAAVRAAPPRPVTSRPVTSRPATSGPVTPRPITPREALAGALSLAGDGRDRSAA